MTLHDDLNILRTTKSRVIDESYISEFNFLWMEITKKCNLSCIHCYADSCPSKILDEGITLEKWLEALQQAADLGCRKVQFTGGEPTLHPNLAELIESARELGFTTVEVFTNGTLFTETLKNCFLRHRTNLAFSIYSAQPNIHDAVTQARGSFSETMTSIQWAVRLGLPVRVAIVQMEANEGCVDQTRQMLEKTGVTSISSGRMRGIGRGLGRGKAAAQLDELCGRCWQGKLCLTSNGEIFPCVFSRFYPIGNLNQGLGFVLNSAQLSIFRETLRSKESKKRWNAQTKSLSCDRNLPDAPCDPDLPDPPCDPDLPDPPCDPDLPDPPCDPDLPDPPCDPDLPDPPCDPDLPDPPYDPDLPALSHFGGNRDGNQGQRLLKNEDD